MRVLVLTNLYPNPYDPNRATFNRQQIAALAGEHAVWVISPIAWATELASWVRQGPCVPTSRCITCDGIPVEHPRYFYTPKLFRGRYGHFYERSVRSTFQRAVREFSPEIVFAPWAYPDGWAAVKLSQRAGLPVVIKVHGCDLNVGGKGLERFPWRRRRTAEALQNADGVVAVSQQLAERVVGLGVERRRVQVVYNGIDSRFFYAGSRTVACRELGLDPDEPTVLFIGGLVPVKSVETLINACALLKQRGLSFRCVLIGDGPLRKRLERQASRERLSRHIKFLGTQPHGQLGKWFRACDVFVLPSLSEGVPNVLLEAIACGAPFVASCVGGIPEIAGMGCGRLVPPSDSPSLAQAIADQLAVPPMRPETWANSPWKRTHGDAAAEIAGMFKSLIRAPRSDQSCAASAT